MTVFSSEAFFDHEQVHFWNDEKAGVKAIAAIHRARPNNAIGGCRMFPYSSEADALADVLRLSRAMSYKCAMAGIQMGGGKCVVIGDPAAQKTDALLRSVGRFIKTLNGQFYTGEDVGIGVADVAIMRQETNFLVGRPGADSSTAAAYGVYVGLRATLANIFGSDDPRGRHVAIQGLGQVGYRLAEHLAEAGAILTVADVNPDLVNRAERGLGARIADPGAILLSDCDVLAPCALGGIITAEIAGRLRCRGIVGAANNQLAEASVAEILKTREIRYAPDYVVNAGGVINNALTLSHDFSLEQVRRDTALIGETLSEVYARAGTDDVTTDAAAARIAEGRMAERVVKGAHA